MYPTDSTPTADPAATAITPPTPDPAQPAAPDPVTDPPVEPTPAAAPSSTSDPQPGDLVRIRFDNGRGTTVEQTALLIGRVDVPDVADGEQLDSTHVEFDVVPVDTMRVGADHLVDDED